MPRTLFCFVALWLSLSTGTSALAAAAAALTPRASAPPIPYYRPAWQCPTSYTAGTTVYPVIAVSFRTATYNAATVDLISCETNLLSCLYDLKTGLIQSISGMPTWCGTGLQPNSGCAYECPLSNGISTDSFLTSSFANYTSGTNVIEKLLCYYGTNTQTGTGSSYDASCTYDFVKGTITAAGTHKSAETCQGPLTLDCGSTATRRRRYRKEDNFTAMLARKALRESQRAAAAPQPAQRPSPLNRRILG